MDDMTKERSTILGIGWIIGTIVGIAIFSICIFLIDEYGIIFGIILGVSGGISIASFIEIDRESITSKQEKIMRWAFILGLLILVIMVAISIFLYLSNLSQECPACP